VRQLENLVFVVLICSLLACALFLRQVSRLRPPQLPPPSPAAQSRETIDKLPAILSTAQLPPMELPEDRNLFKLPWSDVVDETPPPPPPETPISLSTLVWSQVNPIAVINGEILTVGETDSKGEFTVEAITEASVQVRRTRNQKTVLLVPSED